MKVDRSSTTYLRGTTTLLDSVDASTDSCRRTKLNLTDPLNHSQISQTSQNFNATAE